MMDCPVDTEGAGYQEAWHMGVSDDTGCPDSSEPPVLM